MFRSTFLHLPGIGPQRERALWRAGVDSWSRFRAARSVPGVGPERKRSADRALEVLEAAADAEDWPRLGRAIPSAEHWRFYGELAPRAAYLDIETTGTSLYNPVTVVGILHGSGRFVHLVREHDLDGESLAEELADVDLLVTFNGQGFDVPMLDANFPGAVPRVPHLDLRTPLRRLGYTGGLKRIERSLGLSRPEEVTGLGGYEAVLLWRRYSMESDQHALETLLEYNRQDVVNLKPLAERAVGGLEARVAAHAPPAAGSLLKAGAACARP